MMRVERRGVDPRRFRLGGKKESAGAADAMSLWRLNQSTHVISYLARSTKADEAISASPYTPSMAQLWHSRAPAASFLPTNQTQRQFVALRRLTRRLRPSSSPTRFEQNLAYGHHSRFVMLGWRIRGGIPDQSGRAVRHRTVNVRVVRLRSTHQCNPNQSYSVEGPRITATLPAMRTRPHDREAWRQ